MIFVIFYNFTISQSFIKKKCNGLKNMDVHNNDIFFFYFKLKKNGIFKLCSICSLLCGRKFDG